MKNKETNFMPDGLVKFRDIAVGIGIVAVESIFNHLRHEGLSDYPKHVKEISDVQTTRMAQMVLNYDGDGREVAEEIMISYEEES